MFAALLAFSLSFGGHKSPRTCGPAPFAACETSRELITSKEFPPALKRFVGGAEAVYSQRKRPIYKEVIERLSVSGAPAQDVGHGARLFGGCRQNACPEKAAVIADRSGVIAIGVVDYRADFNPNLEVVVARAGPLANEQAAALKAWADREVAVDAEVQHAPIALQGVHIRSLREEPLLAEAKACSRLAALIHRCPQG